MIGLLIYLQSTRAKGKAGEYAMPAFVIFLVAVDAANLYGPPPPNIQVTAIEAEIAYLVFALIAAWLDRLREPPPPEAPVRLELS